MKTLLKTTAIAALLLGFTSCNERAKLADTLTGDWTANPERITTSDAKATTTVSRALTFMTDESSDTGGYVEGGVTFSIMTGTRLLAADVQPISVTARGTATISGRWEAVDDDEVMVTWDYTTLAVNVDPTAVDLDYDIVTGADSTAYETLRPQAVKIITGTMTQALQTEVFNYGKIDDIDFHDNNSSMSVEIGKTDLTFRKF